MVRYIKYIFLAVLGLCLITVGLANRGAVTLRLLPEELAGYVGLQMSYDMPLFVVIFGGIIAGLAIGFALEWMREHKHRVQARTATREKAQLEREVKGMRRKATENQDEVLALLDEGASAR
ncbi:MAG: LapA family protein [Pseudomonadota bacterium]